MTGVLDGIRVIEAAEWGFVPSAGAVPGGRGAGGVQGEQPPLRGPLPGLIPGRALPPAAGPDFFAQRRAFGVFIGGACIAGGVAAALFRRERTGEGGEVDVSLLATAMWVLSPDITAALMYGFMLPASGDMPRAPNPLVGPYRCADGKSIVLMMLQVGRFWSHFTETIGRPDLLERFPDPSPEQSDAIRDELAHHFATRTREEWSARLRASNCIWGPLQTPLELPDDPQVQANGYLLDAGGVRLCANPVQFCGAPPAVRWPAQDTGAATEEVLQELGCSWEDIARWKDAGVIS